MNYKQGNRPTPGFSGSGGESEERMQAIAFAAEPRNFLSGRAAVRLQAEVGGV